MDEQNLPADRTARGITRADLEHVIRRAAELYTREADADERLTQGEVLRIADELGLPARHVRQALYELPSSPPREGVIGRWYGPAIIQATRVVEGTTGGVMARLEDYLVTREFLQVLRQQGGRAVFTPADDAISSVARAVRRPQRHWQIARAQRVLVDVRPIPEQDSHVRLELDLENHRSRAFTGGLAGGAIVGLPLAVGAFLPIAHLALGVGGELAAYSAGLAAGATTFGASVTAGIAIARSRFRSRVDAARLEMASLLDRLETGGRLDPPPAPWLRSLRSRIAGTLRPGSGPASRPGTGHGSRTPDG